MTTQPDAWDATRLTRGEEDALYRGWRGAKSADVLIRDVARAQHAKLAAVLMPLLERLAGHNLSWCRHCQQLGGRPHKASCQFNEARTLVETWEKEQQ